MTSLERLRNMRYNIALLWCAKVMTNWCMVIGLWIISPPPCPSSCRNRSAASTRRFGRCVCFFQQRASSHSLGHHLTLWKNENKLSCWNLVNMLSLMTKWCMLTFWYWVKFEFTSTSRLRHHFCQHTRNRHMCRCPCMRKPRHHPPAASHVTWQNGMTTLADDAVWFVSNCEVV